MVRITIFTIHSNSILLVSELNEMNSVQKTHFIMSAFNCALVPEWLCLYDQMSDFLYQMYRRRTIWIKQYAEKGV
jgi:hypothetical protein